MFVLTRMTRHLLKFLQMGQDKTAEPDVVLWLERVMLRPERAAYPCVISARSMEQNC